MSFNYIAAISCIECKNLYLPKESIAIDLGCQTPSIIIDNIIKFLQNNKKKIHDDQILNLSKLKNIKFSKNAIWINFGPIWDFSNFLNIS